MLTFYISCWMNNKVDEIDDFDNQPGFLSITG
jgi:hypothetical protein